VPLVRMWYSVGSIISALEIWVTITILLKKTILNGPLTRMDMK
jgi:hypothetical protein